MTQEEMLFLVPQKLKQIEKEYGIHVLFAAESGSRAWGTASEKSDFDVRFIYIRPQEDYLRLEGMKDVLEFPIADGWDMCGWDLNKTLRLLRNSNSQIFDWFRTSIVYTDTEFAKRFGSVMERYFSVRTVAFHYLNQVQLRLDKQLKSDPVKVKQYLYAVQYLLAAKWTLEKQAPPPVDFRELMSGLPEELRPEVELLLEQKTTRPDQPWMERSGRLDKYLAKEMPKTRGRILELPAEPERGWEELNRFFLSELERAK